MRSRHGQALWWHPMLSAYTYVGTELIAMVQLFRTPILDAFFLFTTNFGEPPFLIAAAALVALFSSGRRHIGLAMVIAFVTASLVNAELKGLLDVPRPDPSEIDRMQTAAGTSTPSAHSMIAAAVWVVLALSLQVKSWRVLVISIPLLVGFSRVYLGMHYPGDVLLGLGFGILVGGAVYLAVNNLLVQAARLANALPTRQPGRAVRADGQATAVATDTAIPVTA